MRTAAFVLLALAACGDPATTTGDDDPACTEGCACHTDDDCADPHSVCVPSTHASSCDCAAGYDRIDGFTCEWGGVIGDPQFVAGAWDTTPGFNVDPTYAGATLVDPGAALFAVPGPCLGGPPAFPTASQSPTMPRFSRAEPLVATAVYGGLNSAFVSPDLRYGGAVAWQQPANATAAAGFGFVCLGAAAYAPESSTGPGAPVPFALQLEASCSEANGGAVAVLDRVSIDPAPPGVCPAPNVVLGHVDDDTGWSYSFNPGSDIVGYTPGIGENGTPGMRLAGGGFGEPFATTRVSVPVSSDAGNPSLRIWRSVENTANAQLAMSEFPDLDFAAISLPVSSPGPGVDHYCLPPGMFGTVAGFKAMFFLLQPTVSMELDLDSVSVQPDPACGTDPHLTDPGFESGYPLVAVESGALLLQPTEDADAHGGTRDLLISTSDCAQTDFGLEFIRGDFTNPALTFWYRTSDPTPFLFTPALVDGAQDLVRDGEWHEATTCLDNLYTAPDVPVDVFWDIVGEGDCTGTMSIAFDDLEVTSDVRCGQTTP
ncbi:MAG TPA: hypothetical protein VGM88_35300 [Kofleriaceae bacterium]